MTSEAQRRIDHVLRTGARTLDLGGLELTDVPDSLRELFHLGELDLSGNSLTELPEWLGSFSYLRELDVSGNLLTTVPESLGNISPLSILKLHGNRLTTLPESLTALSRLERLQLGANRLRSLPEWLGDLRSVSLLDLTVNGLSTLPESMGNLTSLTSLFLNLNRLATLPESLGNLTSLTVLDLTGNRLTGLPESMARLTSLTELDLRRNAITRLPDWLRELPNLTLLKLGPDFPDPPDWARRLAHKAQAPSPAPRAGREPVQVTPPARALRPLAGRRFIVGIRPVRLRGVEDGGLACEAFDWATGGFILDNGYLSKVISGYGEVDEISAQEFDAAVERLCTDRGFMGRHEPGTLQRVGFFREMPHGTPADPSLQAARGETAYPGQEDIASYLEHGQVHIATPGPGHDVLDPTRRTDPPHYLTDGRFVWPGDLAYYVRNYHVRLPEPFIAHMAAAGWSIPPDIDETTVRLPPAT